MSRTITHDSIRTTRGTAHLPPAGQPIPAVTRNRRTRDDRPGNSEPNPLPGSRTRDLGSLSQDYAAELEAWARHASAANGFGDLA